MGNKARKLRQWKVLVWKVGKFYLMNCLAFDFDKVPLKFITVCAQYELPRKSNETSNNKHDCTPINWICCITLWSNETSNNKNDWTPINYIEYVALHYGLMKLVTTNMTGPP